MSLRDIEDRISAYIKRSRRLTNLEREADIFRSRLVNSMFVVQLIAFVEREFSVTVEDDDLKLANFSSVANAALFVAQKLRGGQASQP